MAVLTITQRLENIQTIIQDVETSGQSYKNDGRSFTKGDLAVLYAQEARLLAQYNAETFGKARNLVKFKDPV